MKKIGFVDYYLSEWHANNYPAWIKEVNPDYEIAYAWAELDTSPRDGVTSAEWCEKNGAQLCSGLEELCEKSDVIVILAPTDPDRHLPYAKVVLPYGKRTYIDKTFAPNRAIAEEIFALAKQYNTPFFSTSALRYAEELNDYEGCTAMITQGGGSLLEEYIIHQAEMIVKKLGGGGGKILATKFANGYHFRVQYTDGREAMLTFDPSMSFSVCMLGGRKGKSAKVSSPFFPLLMADMVRFFEEGTVSFDVSQTLEVMRLRDGVLASVEALDEWIEF